jgi:D-alanyl-D-alanine carboxypeptidase
MSQMLKKSGGLLLVLCLAIGAAAQTSTTSADPKIDAIAQDVLQKTGVPSASVAVVKDGKIVYKQAYGSAKLDSKTPATTSMRYSIGSISKQFTATAVLLLQEQGKLSLDDKVSKYFPDLTRANEISVRQLLSMTSGYQDFWPQDYVMPEMLGTTNPQHILDKWAKIPLDFEPGTKWQYSNTNYAIAGLIIKKITGMDYFQYLGQKVFQPLGLQSVLNIDQGKLTQSDPTGYMRYALGPLRPAPKEGAGWLYAMGEIAMTPEDLARWDISVIDQKVLKPESYKLQQTEVQLKNGVGTGYGLGVSIGRGAHRSISHRGEVSGFTATNTIFPDDKAAVVVLTNQDAIGASGQIAARIAETFFQPAAQTGTTKETETAKQILAGLQQGKIDRSLFTDNANFYFNDTCLKDNADSLGPLGTIQEFAAQGESLRGGMNSRGYRAKMSGGKTLSISTFWMPDGKIEQYIVTGRE